jgi:hypothetical protein
MVFSPFIQIEICDTIRYCVTYFHLKYCCIENFCKLQVKRKRQAMKSYVPFETANVCLEYGIYAIYAETTYYRHQTVSSPTLYIYIIYFKKLQMMSYKIKVITIIILVLYPTVSSDSFRRYPTPSPL